MTQYWGSSNPGTVFQANSPYLTQIANAAAAEPSGAFAAGRAADAADFYDWVVNQMEEPPVPGNLNHPDPVWNEELSALYQIDYRTIFECQRCHTMVTVNGATLSARSISLIFNPTGQNDGLEFMLDDHLRGHVQRTCTTCNGLEWHVQRRKIEAAPQVLRIFVQIFGNDGVTPVKLCREFVVPRTLWLTEEQVNAELPLTYSLSSAIAHGGGRQHKERGLDAVSPVVVPVAQRGVGRGAEHSTSKSAADTSNTVARSDPCPSIGDNVANLSNIAARTLRSPSTVKTKGRYALRSKINKAVQLVQKPSVGRFISMVPCRENESTWRPGYDRAWKLSGQTHIGGEKHIRYIRKNSSEVGDYEPHIEALCRGAVSRLIF